MTLKLTLGLPRSARATEPDPERERDVEEEHVPEPSPSVRRATELELALAMGTVAESSAAARTNIEDGLEEFTADELIVEELGMAMGAVIEPSAPPLDETDSLAEEHPPDTVPAKSLNGSSWLAAGPPVEQVANPEGALDEAAPAYVPTLPELVLDAGAMRMHLGDEDGAPDTAILETPADAAEVSETVSAPRLDGAVVAVLGLDPSGLGAAMALRRAGAKVIGIERSASRLERIRSGASGLARGAQQELRSLLAGRGFILTEDPQTLAAAEYVVVCVAAGVDGERRPNPEPLERACAAVVEHARSGQTILLTSSSHVGSTRELLVDPLEERGLQVGEDVFVAYAGAQRDADEAGRPLPLVVGALSESCYQRALALLGHLGTHLERVSSPETAEMAKLYADTFGAVRVALAFEMADACRANGLNPIEVADAIGGEPAEFATSWTSPDLDGCAVGVDAHHLAQPLRGGGRPATITEEALRKLAARPRQVVWRAQELLVRSGRELAGAPILVVGASCRPGAVDIRNAPALEIIGRLLAEGADVDYHDPLLPDLQIGDEWISGVDPDPRRDASGFGPEDYALAIIVTLHPGHDYGWLRRVPEVLDCTYRTPGGQRRFVL